MTSDLLRHWLPGCCRCGGGRRRFPGRPTAALFGRRRGFPAPLAGWFRRRLLREQLLTLLAAVGWEALGTAVPVGVHFFAFLLDVLLAEGD